MSWGDGFKSAWGDALSGMGGVITHGFGAVLDVASFGTALGDSPTDEYHKMLGDLGKTFHGIHGGTGWFGDAAAWTMRHDYQWYSDYVSRPIATTITAASLTSSKTWQKKTGDNEFTSMFNGDTWSKAWDIAHHRSPGQAFWLQGTSDILDKNEVDDYQRQWWFTLLSGASDAVTSTSLDPLGKVFKVVGRTGALKTTAPVRGRNLENTLSQIGSHEFATSAGRPLPNTPIVHALDWMQRTADNAPDVGTAAKQIEKHPMLRTSRQGGLIAHMMADSSRSDKNLIARTVLGDGEAYTRLNAMRADLARRLTQLYSVRPDLALAENPSEILGRVMNVDEKATKADRLAQFNEEINALEKRESWINDLIGPEGTDKPGVFGAVHQVPKTGEGFASANRDSNVLTKAASKSVGAAQRSLAASTAPIYATLAEKGAEARSAVAQYSQRSVPHDVHYYNPFNAAVRVLGKADNFFNRQAPRGYLDTNDPEGWRELDNTLASAKGFDPARRQSLIGEYMGATSEVEKLAVAKKAEAEAFGHLIKMHDPMIDPSEIDSIVGKYASSRDKMRVTLKNRAYTAAKDDNGQRIDFVDNENTPTVIHPVLASNLAEKIPLADMEVINKALARRGSGVLRVAAKLTDPAFDMADIMMSAWKVTSLMRMGYMVRVLADDELAYIAHLGAMTALRPLPEGVGNYIANKAIRTGLKARQGVYHAKNVMQFGTDPVRYVSDQLAQARGHIIDPDLNAALRKTPSQAFLPTPDELKPGRKKYLGQKSQDVKLQNGQTVTLQGFAPATKMGDYWRAQSSDDRLAMDDVSDSYLGKMRKEMAHGLVNHGDDGYYKSWAKALNQQLGSDEMGRLLLGGRNAPYVANWLKIDQAGRAYAKRLPLRALDPDRWAHNVGSYVEQYAPTPELRAAALTGKVTEGMLKKVPLQLRPEQVHGAMLDYNMGKGGIAGQMLRFREGFFRRFNQIPTDTMVRHPLAKALYETRRNELINSFNSTGGVLDNPVLRKMENQARGYTIKEINNIVLDLSTHSNAAHVLRFIAPFYNAWDKALKRWGRMAYGDPSIIFKGNRLWQGINNMPIMFDSLTGRTGGDVENSKGQSLYNPKRGVNGYTGIGNASDQFLVFRMPEAMAKRIGATVMDQVAIPKSSLNLVLQGDPWYLPGFGPFVQLPASKLVESQPQYADMMKTILPYGPQDWKNTFLPTSARKLGDWQADDSQQYQGTMVNIWRTRMAKWMESGKQGPMPSFDDPSIAKDAGRLHALRFASQMLMPFNVQFQTPYKFYLDQYHKLMEDPKIGPQKARDVFLQQYPDYFAFADSISKNNSGLPATVQAYAASKKYGKLMAKTPDIAGAVIGDAAQGGDFSPTVYKLQFSQRLNPASSQTARQGQDLQTFAKGALAEQGWVQFKKISDQIRVELTNRGLESTQQKGAEDLKKIKAAVVEKLAQIYPDWYADYQSFDPAKQQNVVNQLTYLAAQPQVKNRSDIAQLQQYLASRNMILDELARRKAANASGNLAANSNNDLQALWAHLREQYATQHTVFSDVIYDRYLNHDDQLMVH